MSDLITQWMPAEGGESPALIVAGSATHQEAPELREALFEAIGRTDARRLRVDLSRVETMDTAALAVLVEGLIATRKKQPVLELCHPSPAAEKIFQLASFVRLMSEVPDPGLDEALRRCRCEEAARAGEGR